MNIYPINQFNIYIHIYIYIYIYIYTYIYIYLYVYIYIYKHFVFLVYCNILATTLVTLVSHSHNLSHLLLLDH